MRGSGKHCRGSILDKSVHDLNESWIGGVGEGCSKEDFGGYLRKVLMEKYLFSGVIKARNYWLIIQFWTYHSGSVSVISTVERTVLENV